MKPHVLFDLPLVQIAIVFNFMSAAWPGANASQTLQRRWPSSGRPPPRTFGRRTIFPFDLSAQTPPEDESTDLDTSSTTVVGGPTSKLKNAKLLSVEAQKPVLDVKGNVIPEYDAVYEFDQLKDHNDPSAGTFKQRYFHTWEFYQPGGPIILVSVGEQSILSGDTDNSIVITNSSLAGHLAQQLSGAVVLLEHRFYGESQPATQLVPALQRYHTIEQSIEDLVYFARNVVEGKSEEGSPLLQMAKETRHGGGGFDGGSLAPSRTPWILVGGSYSGALVAWTMHKHPNIFWAGYSSSGVIQPIIDFHEYFTPIQEYMPANCSTDVSRVIDYIDDAIDAQDTALITRIRTMFGMPGDVDLTVFLRTLSSPVSQWQMLDVSTPDDDFEQRLFYGFCDALEENDSPEPPSAAGVGFERALTNWAGWMTSVFLPTACKTKTPTTDFAKCVIRWYEQLRNPLLLGLDDRPWMWTVCSEVGWMASGRPNSTASDKHLVSRHLNATLHNTLCDYVFPGAFSNSSVGAFRARIKSTEESLGGWEKLGVPGADGGNGTAAGLERLFVVNGIRDPWLYATHSAPTSPLFATSNASAPGSNVRLTDGFHCSDLWMVNGLYSAEVDAAQKDAVEKMKVWMEEFVPVGEDSTDGGVRGRRWDMWVLYGLMGSTLLWIA